MSLAKAGMPRNPAIHPCLQKGRLPFVSCQDIRLYMVNRKNGTKKRIYATNTGPFEPLRGHILFSPGTIFYYRDNTIIFNKLQQDFINFFNNSFDNLSKVYITICVSEYYREIYAYIIMHLLRKSNKKKRNPMPDSVGRRHRTVPCLLPVSYRAVLLSHNSISVSFSRKRAPPMRPEIFPSFSRRRSTRMVPPGS